jgi:hypothetical protein
MGFSRSSYLPTPFLANAFGRITKASEEKNSDSQLLTCCEPKHQQIFWLSNFDTTFRLATLSADPASGME